MLIPADNGRRQSAYIVVIGNEKGGSGKSTIAIHIAIALMQAGRRVATVDLDGRQKSLTHYIENRRAWAKRSHLPVPVHYCLEHREFIRADANENAQFNELFETIMAIESDHDFIVIDTPGSDSYIMRLAHSLADTLVTPLNDSFVDFDTLGTVDPVTYALTGTSPYAAMVRKARRDRHSVGFNDTDWVIIRNRLSHMRSRSSDMLAENLNVLGLQLGFRCAEGLTERLIYREFFPRGLCALDTINKSTLGRRPDRSHQNARQEIQSLITALKLPIDEKGQRRAAARANWFASLKTPIEVTDLIFNENLTAG